MILIQWLTFLFLTFSFLSTNYIFLTMYSNLRFRISYYDLHSYSIIFKNILSSSSFLFCPSFSSFSFHFSSFFLISHLSFFFSFLIFLFFSFPKLHHFLNLVCHFVRAPLPCSRTFCCPAYNWGYLQYTTFRSCLIDFPLTTDIPSSQFCVFTVKSPSVIQNQTGFSRTCF